MPGCLRLGWRHGLLDEVLRVSEITSDHDCIFVLFFLTNLSEQGKVINIYAFHCLVSSLS
jgi:hypothetical protein